MRCERVPLVPHSAEFKDVEKQFRKSLKLTTVITSIERVQSSSMSKKYRRYVQCKLQYLEIPPRSGGWTHYRKGLGAFLSGGYYLGWIKWNLRAGSVLPGEQSPPDLPWSIL